MFSATLMSQYGANGQVIIKVDGVETTAIFLDGTRGSYGHTTNLAIVECDAGGRMWMKCATDNTKIYMNPSYNQNTFSGMLDHAF